MIADDGSFVVTGRAREGGHVEVERGALQPVRSSIPRLASDPAGLPGWSRLASGYELRAGSRCSTASLMPPSATRLCPVM